MSRSFDEKRWFRRVRLRPESSKMSDAISSRHTFGSTEKILRRNRKTWTRLLAKRRRAHGQRMIREHLLG